MANFGRKKLLAFEPVEFDKKIWDIRRSNPNYWKADGVRKTDAVYAPSFPEIEKAYSDAGVIVYRPIDAPVIKEVEIATFDDYEDSSDQSEQVDYNSMSAGELKEIASGIIGESVKTKAEALDIINQAVIEGKL